jgi:hypothetical protein
LSKVFSIQALWWEWRSSPISNFKLYKTFELNYFDLILYKTSLIYVLW